MDRSNHLPGKLDGKPSMQVIRNITWRLIALVFFVLLCYSLLPLFINSGEGFATLPLNTIFGSFTAIAIGFVVPSKLLKIPQTLNHEVGHALAASLMGESVHLIRVEIDTSGVTYTMGKRSRFHSMFRSAGGPLASAAFFVFTAALISGNKAVLWILFALIATILITVTTVRSIWGWVSAAIVIATLGQSLWASIQIGSDSIGNATFGIWSASTWNIAILLSAYTCGIALRYSIACRKPWSESQDEAKVGRALGVHPTIGGHLILILNIVLIFAAITMILGWVNPWTPSPFV